VKTPITPLRLAVHPRITSCEPHEKVPDNFSSGSDLAKTIGLGIGITLAEYAILILLISMSSH
jgi:hypothetical protein